MLVDLWQNCTDLGGGSIGFYVSARIGEMLHFDEHIFQMGWFNHQLEIV